MLKLILPSCCRGSVLHRPGRCWVCPKSAGIAPSDLSVCWYGQGWKGATVNLRPYHPHFCLVKFVEGVSLTVIRLDACSCLLIHFCVNFDLWQPFHTTRKLTPSQLRLQLPVLTGIMRSATRNLPIQRHSPSTKAPEGATEPGCTSWCQDYCSIVF